MELAYAALKNRPIVFLSLSTSSSRTILTQTSQSRTNRKRLILNLKTANQAYGTLIPTSEDNLIAALDGCLHAALKAPGRTEGVRKIAKRFGVDPGTVQRISRPFDAAANVVAA